MPAASSVNVDVPSAAPVADWVDPAELFIDPYPAYQRLRDEAPVAWVPSLNRFLVTTYDDCVTVERATETFSSHEASERSTMVRSIGRPMIRKDGEEHRDERGVVVSAVRPIAIRRVWRQEAERLTDLHLDRLRQAGPGADLYSVFAVPFAADMLSAVVGVRDISAETIADWSQTIVAGIGNVTGDPVLIAEVERVDAEINDAIDAVAPILRETPDASILSALLHAHELSDEQIRANVKLSISGGMNEPSHVIASAVHLLDLHPDQRAAVLAGDHSWSDVFEETARHQSPVGMYPRDVLHDTEIGGVAVPAGTKVGVVIASANRDERRFADADVFDIGRDRISNVAFGSGPHVCVGNNLARDMIGAVALPRLYEAFPGLAVIDPETVPFRGWVFRGATTLPVTW